MDWQRDRGVGQLLSGLNLIAVPLPLWKKKPNRLSTLIVAAAVALFYPLSIGPVAFLAQFVDFKVDESPAGELAIRFYWPFFHLPDPMHQWAVEWWNCGTRTAGWIAMRIPALRGP